MDRHAYMIIAHTNFEQLGLLLQLLDRDSNDIYLLIDKKVKNPPREFLKKQVKKASLLFTKPVKVSWGGDSVIKAEMQLLKIAIKEEHKYYHLISGMDLPIKSQNYIYSFFDENDGKNFISLELNHEHNQNGSTLHRLDYYYPFQNLIGRNEGRRIKIYKKMQDFLIQLQKGLKYSRTKNNALTFLKGCNWFSITHEAAQYVVNNYPRFKSIFRFTLIADEMFMQTILYNSPLSNTIADKNLRLIDWNRGAPYTFVFEDFPEIINSDRLFARKFDERVDKEVILKIYDYLNKFQ